MDSSFYGERLSSNGLPATLRRTTSIVVFATAFVLGAVFASGAFATPTFLSPVNLSDPGQDGFEPVVAEDASGNSLFVWTRFDGTNLRIQARLRAPDGTFAATQTISDPGGDASEPQLALDPSGNAVAVWNRFDGSKTRVQAAYRPAGGSFGTPQTVSGGGQNASNPQVSMDQSGDAVAVWERSDGANLRIESAIRPAGGSFGATTILSVSGQAAYEPKVAAGPNIDDNAVAVWTRSDGTKLRVQSARRRDVVGYPRPKGATPLYAALVPAFEACTSANRTHGAPLSSPSCAPPVQSSSILTIGTPDAPNNGQAANFSGFVRYTNLSSDIRLQASLTDVRNNPSLSDYTGSVQVSTNVQLTDNLNSQETPEPGTVQAFKYTFDAPCTTTASTSIGSTCAVSTTANSLVPGTVVSGARSIWALGQVEVKDPGPNATFGDGDDGTFARQGVFVP